MGVGEFRKWIEYGKTHPLGGDAALMAGAIAAHAVMTAAGAKRIKLQDFFPKYGDTTLPTADELREKMERVLG